jgi:hypothetical protein
LGEKLRMKGDESPRGQGEDPPQPKEWVASVTNAGSSRQRHGVDVENESDRFNYALI